MAIAMPVMTVAVAQLTPVMGTGARWAKGDRFRTHRGAPAVSATTRSRKPPVAGREPAKTTRRGATPTARTAAPVLSHTIGRGVAGAAQRGGQGQAGVGRAGTDPGADTGDDEQNQASADGGEDVGTRQPRSTERLGGQQG